MAIKVGINENVQLKSAEINDKGTLVITFTQGEAMDQQSIDDLLNQSAGVKQQGSTNIMLWPVNTENSGTPRTAEQISKDFVSLRDQLEEVLRGYMTSDNAKLDPYAGIGLTAENFATLILKQSTADAIYKNLTSQFVAKVRSLGEAQQKKFRLLLVRKSETNHYGTFRRNFILDNPFYESMEVPAAASRVKFTKYEIGKGLNNPNAVNREEAADQTDATQSTADDILGSR